MFRDSLSLDIPLYSATEVSRKIPSSRNIALYFVTIPVRSTKDSRNIPLYSATSRLRKSPVLRDIPLYSATNSGTGIKKSPARRVRREGVTPTNNCARARPSVNRPRASGGVFGQTIPTLPRVYAPLRGSIRHVHGFWSPFGLVVKRDGVFAPRFNERASARRGCAEEEGAGAPLVISQYATEVAGFVDYRFILFLSFK